MDDDTKQDKAIYALALQINQALAVMADALSRLSKTPAPLESASSLAVLAQTFKAAIPDAMKELAAAIKAQPAPRVVVQAPAHPPERDDSVDYTWTIEHEITREGMPIRSIVTRTSVQAPKLIK